MKRNDGCLPPPEAQTNLFRTSTPLISQPRTGTKQVTFWANIPSVQELRCRIHCPTRPKIPIFRWVTGDRKTFLSFEADVNLLLSKSVLLLTLRQQPVQGIIPTWFYLHHHSRQHPVAKISSAKNPRTWIFLRPDVSHRRASFPTISFQKGKTLIL